jgi:hypothetical protein
MVTIVRKIISFEEVVMTKNDFMKLNKELEYCYKIEELRETMYDTISSGIAPHLLEI